MRDGANKYKSDGNRSFSVVGKALARQARRNVDRRWTVSELGNNGFMIKSWVCRRVYEMYELLLQVMSCIGPKYLVLGG